MFSGNNNYLNLEFSDDYNDYNNYNSFNEIEENLINYNIEIDNNENEIDNNEIEIENEYNNEIENEIDNENEYNNENENDFDLLNNINNEFIIKDNFEELFINTNNEENKNKNKKIEIIKENKCCICGKEKELKELKETNQKCCDNCKNIIYDYEMNIIKKKKCIKCKNMIYCYNCFRKNNMIICFDCVVKNMYNIKYLKDCNIEEDYYYLNENDIEKKCKRCILKPIYLFIRKTKRSGYKIIDYCQYCSLIKKYEKINSINKKK